MVIHFVVFISSVLHFTFVTNWNGTLEIVRSYLITGFNIKRIVIVKNELCIKYYLMEKETAEC